MGLDAVLCQAANGEEHPVLYLTHTVPLGVGILHDRKGRTGCEMDSLQCYFLGNPFKLVPNHAPLRWLNAMEDTNHQLISGYLNVQPYDFKIQHRMGKAHQKANFSLRDVPQVPS